MMGFPLGLWDLSLWLAATSTILLVASELISLHQSRVRIYVNKERLRNTAFAVSIAFLVTVAIRVVGIIT